MHPLPAQTPSLCSDQTVPARQKELPLRAHRLTLRQAARAHRPRAAPGGLRCKQQTSGGCTPRVASVRHGRRRRRRGRRRTRRAPRRGGNRRRRRRRSGSSRLPSPHSSPRYVPPLVSPPPPPSAAAAGPSPTARRPSSADWYPRVRAHLHAVAHVLPRPPAAALGGGGAREGQERVHGRRGGITDGVDAASVVTWRTLLRRARGRRAEA